MAIDSKILDEVNGLFENPIIIEEIKDKEYLVALNKLTMEVPSSFHFEYLKRVEKNLKPVKQIQVLRAEEISENINDIFQLIKKLLNVPDFNEAFFLQVDPFPENNYIITLKIKDKDSATIVRNFHIRIIKGEINIINRLDCFGYENVSVEVIRFFDFGLSFDYEYDLINGKFLNGPKGNKSKINYSDVDLETTPDKLTKKCDGNCHCIHPCPNCPRNKK